jgi:uncharacterized protein YajQ (UPF0234 family)
MPRKCIKCKLKRPNFNNPNEDKGLYCSDCKTDDMIDVKNRKCIKCKLKQPAFNNPNEVKGLYCADCKTDDMIDVISRKCIKCKLKRPYFNNPNEVKGLYCADCKTDDMIDVISRKCIKCKLKRPNFNNPNEDKGLYCGDCKTNDMIDVKNRKCIICKLKQPVFNNQNEVKGLYCSDCKTDDMINVISRRCKSSWCSTIVKNKYKGYCLFCYIHLFPNENICKNYRTKEKAVCDYIKINFPQFNIINDKKIKGGCSNRRPDIYIELDNQIIIIEIDENQHNNYDCSCENKRLMEISRDVNYKSIIFIRFNPDDYIINNDKITSCWSINKNGLLTIKKSKIIEWDNRLNNLRECIKYWLFNNTNKIIEIIHLFYDIN